MKVKSILLLAALAASIILTGCKSEEPYDTQSADDAPLILKPYNESGTGSFTYNLANPDTPLFDSVTVTPSRFTTVKWYVDNQLVNTGYKINQCFPAGSYVLRIEATTEAGKSTHRDGSIVVHPYDTDPYAAAPAGGRHCVPEMETEISGQNLSKVATVILAEDIFCNKVVCSVAPSFKDDATLKFTLPAVEDGAFYLFFRDDAGKNYGSDVVNIHNGAVILTGYDSFVPGETWVMTGVNLENVASVKVDDEVITELLVTATSVSLTAPAADFGEHTLSMKNKDGSDVLFVTSAGTLIEVTTTVSEEITLWTGPVDIAWDADLVKVTADVMEQVPVGSMIYLYFEVQAGAEYYALRVTTPWWDGYDLVSQINDANTLPNPYGFEYTDERKGFVDLCGAMSVVGNGLTITKITFK